MQFNQSNTKGIIMGVLAAVFWGINGAVSQYLLSHYDITSYELACLRMLSAGLLIIILSMLRSGKHAFDVFRLASDRKKLLLFAICGLLFNQICYFNAIRYTDAGTATIMQSMSTIVILLFTSFTKKTFPPKLQVAAVILALIGVYMISTDPGTGLSLSPAGLFWGPVLAIAAASYILLSRPLTERWNSLTVTGFGMLIGGILFSLAVHPWEIRVVPDLPGILLFAYHVIFGTVAAFSLFLSCVHEIGPVRGNLIGNIEPLTASIVSALLLHTSFSVRDITGFILILIAVIVVQVSA